MLPHQHAAAADAPRSGRPQASRRTVLVVEDDPDILEMVRFTLEQHGYEVETATNGAEALERLAETRRPCVILLDLFMPVMNGMDFLRSLRADADHVIAALPVVVVSAAEGIAAREAEHLADGFLRKPVAVESFLSVVSRYCGARP